MPGALQLGGCLRQLRLGCLQRPTLLPQAQAERGGLVPGALQLGGGLRQLRLGFLPRSGCLLGIGLGVRQAQLCRLQLRARLLQLALQLLLCCLACFLMFLQVKPEVTNLSHLMQATAHTPYCTIY